MVVDMLLFVDLHDVHSKRLCGEEAATLNPNPDTIWAWRTLVLCAKVATGWANKPPIGTGYC